MTASRPCSSCTFNGKPTSTDPARRQLGEWLALWLDAVSCRACKGAARYRHEQEWGERPRRPDRCPPDIEPVKDPGCGWAWSWPCEHCHGSGIELGAHEQRIIDALDRLAEAA